MSATCRSSASTAGVWGSAVGRPFGQVTLAGDGSTGCAIIPRRVSGQGTRGPELRDGSASFGGLDVMRAVAHVDSEIARDSVAGLAADDQAALDARLVALDSTPAKSRLGANATLAVSMAAARAAATARGVPLCTATSAATARR